MRDYAKITPSFWIGRTGRALRGDANAQIVAMYLLTSPLSSMIGVFYCPVASIANDTGLHSEGASKALRRLQEADFCTFDPETDFVWVHEMVRFQVGDQLKATDNRLKGIQSDYDRLPEGPVKAGFFERYRDDYGLVDTPKKAAKSERPLEAPSKPLRSQEQEQEKEQEKKTLGASAPKVSASPSRFPEFWAVYPKREGPNPKKPAQALFDQRVAHGADPDVIIAAARDLAKEHPTPTRFCPQAMTWLRQDRFADQASTNGGPVDVEVWSKRMEHGRKRRQWASSKWGPAPGKPGCKVPAGLLQNGDGVDWTEWEIAA